MANLAGLRGIQERLYLHRKRESTYGTSSLPTTEDTTMYVYNCDVGEPPAPDVEKEDDELIANGVEGAIYEHIHAKSLSNTRRMRGTPESITHLWAAALGTDAVSAGDGVNDKVHSVTMNSLSTGIYGFSAESFLSGGGAPTAGEDKVLTGLQVGRVALSWERQGFVMLEWDWRSGGSAADAGNNRDESTMNLTSKYWIPVQKIRTQIAAPGTEHYSTLTSAAYTPATSAGTFANSLAGATTYSTEVNSGKIEWNNQLDEAMSREGGVSSGAGVLGGQAPIGENARVGTLDLDMVVTTNTRSFYDALYNSTSQGNQEYTIYIECVTDELISSDYKGFLIILPLVGIRQSPKLSATPGLRGMPIQFYTKKDQNSGDLDLIYFFSLIAETGAFGATS